MLTHCSCNNVHSSGASFRYTGSMLPNLVPLRGFWSAVVLLALSSFHSTQLPAADKFVGPYPGTSKAATVQIDAELYLDKAQVESLIGNSMDGYLVVVKVKVSPLRAKEPVRLFRDDFVLVSAKDGQRSQPFAPEQLAGTSTMVVSQVLISAGPVEGQQRGPVWGPPAGGGPVPMGGPRRIDTPGSSGGSIGTPTAGATGVKQEIRDDKATDSQTEWLDLLKAKVLAEGEIGETVEGLLYFPLNGKHKPKQMTLLFNGTWPKLELSFEEKKR
ncbi:MAG: hypothetical protein KIT83_22620 [Bryobacterales bacterium]|nr:hypothetical protein [Bryobacterales bacterium]